MSVILELSINFICTFCPSFLLLLLRSSRCNYYSPCYACDVMCCVAGVLQAMAPSRDHTYHRAASAAVAILHFLASEARTLRTFFGVSSTRTLRKFFKGSSTRAWERSLDVAALVEGSFSRRIDTYELHCYSVRRIGILALQNKNAQCGSRRQKACILVKALQ